MKKEKTFNLIGIILGIAIIIAGISIMKNPAETWSTSYYNKFGQESRAASLAFFPSHA